MGQSFNSYSSNFVHSYDSGPSETLGVFRHPGAAPSIFPRFLCLIGQHSFPDMNSSCAPFTPTFNSQAVSIGICDTSQNHAPAQHFHIKNEKSPGSALQAKPFVFGLFTPGATSTSSHQPTTSSTVPCGHPDRVRAWLDTKRGVTSPRQASHSQSLSQPPIFEAAISFRHPHGTLRHHGGRTWVPEASVYAQTGLFPKIDRVSCMSVQTQPSIPQTPRLPHTTQQSPSTMMLLSTIFG